MSENLPYQICNPSKVFYNENSITPFRCYPAQTFVTNNKVLQRYSSLNAAFKHSDHVTENAKKIKGVGLCWELCRRYQSIASVMKMGSEFTAIVKRLKRDRDGFVRTFLSMRSLWSFVVIFAHR